MAQIIEVSEQGIKGGAHIARGQEGTSAGLVQIHMLRRDGVALDCLFMIHGRAQMGSRSWRDGGNRDGSNIGHSNKVVVVGDHYGVIITECSVRSFIRMAWASRERAISFVTVGGC